MTDKFNISQSGYKSDRSAVSNNYVFYYKKTEKIVSALYLISQHLHDNEPFKWQIRQKATELIARVRVLKDTTGAVQEEGKERVQQTAQEVISMLNIARTSGLVSPANCDVCIRELGGVSDGIAASDDFSAPLGLMLTDQFFEVRDTARMEGAAVSEVSRQSGFGTRPVKPSAGKRVDGADEATSSGPNNPHTPSQSPKPAVQAKKNHRQRAILKLIREQGEISVRDAAEVVTNCSEKTLQRELMALVKEGVLRKEGKRRWTRYSFA